MRASNCWLITSQTRRPVTTCGTWPSREVEHRSVEPVERVGTPGARGTISVGSDWPPKIFSTEPGVSLFDEVRKLVAKTIGAAQLIAQSLKKIEGIDEAYLYGSFASNQQDAASDVDVLVIGAPREEDLAQAVRALERKRANAEGIRVASRSEGCVSGKRLAIIRVFRSWAQNEETKAAHR